MIRGYIELTCFTGCEVIKYRWSYDSHYISPWGNEFQQQLRTLQYLIYTMFCTLCEKNMSCEIWAISVLSLHEPVRIKCMDQNWSKENGQNGQWRLHQNEIYTKEQTVLIGLCFLTTAKTTVMRIIFTATTQGHQGILTPTNTLLALWTWDSKERLPTCNSTETVH